MANNFGALTDHWGLTDAAAALDGIAEVIASSSVPVAKSVERALNFAGDPVAEDGHGQTAAGTLADVSVTYRLTSGTLNLNTLMGGEIAANQIVNSIEINTSNTENPTIKFSGQLGTITVVAPTGFLNTWSIADSITITAAKYAQELGFTIAANCDLTSASYSVSLDISNTTDGVNTIVAQGVSGGVVAIGCEMTVTTGTASWTPGGTFIETQEPGADEPQAGYWTASAAAEKLIARDASA